MSRFQKVETCLKKLEFSSMSSYNFEDRLMIQKIVYLLQRKGLGFSYPYNLYIRGPYSPELCRDVFGNNASLHNLETTVHLSQGEVAIVDQLKDSIDLIPSQLEVAATYAYFAYELGCSPSHSTASVRRMKGFYPEAQIALGISRAKQFLFEPSSEEIADMKREARAWENVSNVNKDG